MGARACTMWGGGDGEGDGDSDRFAVQVFGVGESRSSYNSGNGRSLPALCQQPCQGRLQACFVRFEATTSLEGWFG